jgi:hypothetical protein
MSITQLLLDFLLNLLKDPKAAEEFKADPQGVLDAHGLGNITEEDCDAVIPVVLDFAPVSAIGDRVYETGGNVLHGGDSNYGGGNGGGGHGGGGHGGGGHGGGHAPVDTSPAVAQLTHVVNNYSYSEIDDRDTITDQSVNQNIWALGDVEQWFDNDAIVASGDGAAAAGDDAFVDNSDDHSTNIDVGGDVNIGNTEDSYNDDHSTDNSVDVDVDVEDSIIANESFNEEETDNSTNVDIEDSLLANDSFNETDNSDNSVNDSGNTDVDLDAEFENSFNTDASTNNTTTTNTATDSFNETETDVDVDAEFENSFNEDTAIAQDSFNPEDSLNDESTNVTTGDIDVEAEFTKNEDSVIFEENDVNVAVDDSAVVD